MKRYVLTYLLFSSLLSPLYAQTARYTAYIEMERAYISGLCLLQTESDMTKGCIFNEFGITAVEFTYDQQRQKVKLHRVMDLLDRWYIRKVLKKDLARLMDNLQHGEYEYENQKRHIHYRLTPLTNTTEPSDEPEE